MTLLLPWFSKHTGGLWPALGAGVLLIVAFYFLTMRLLKVVGVNLLFSKRFHEKPYSIPDSVPCAAGIR